MSEDLYSTAPTAADETTSPTNASKTCDDISSFWDGLVKLYLLPYAAAIIFGLSFTVQRTRMRPSCCWGRPGIAFPVNLLDEFGRRWLFAVCYIIMASNVLGLFFGSMYFDPMPRDDKEWMLKFSWVSVFVKLVNVAIVCFVYYPLFACVSHRQHIAANVFGFMYAAPLLALQILVIVDCSKIPNSASNLTAEIVVWIPQILSLLIYLICCLAEFIRNVCIYRNRNGITEISESLQSEGNEIKELSAYHRYVKELMLRHRNIEPNEEEPTTARSKVMKTLAGLVDRFKYRNVIGFRYPVRLICALVISAIVVFWLVVEIGVVFDEKIVDLQIVFVGWATLIKGDAFGQRVHDYVNIIRIVFHVSSTTSGVLQIVYMFYTLVTFKRRMLKLFRGDNNWHVAIRSSPAAILVGGMRYPGYQIAFLIYGWLFTTIMLLLILSAASILVIVPIRDRVRNFIVNKIIQLWPAVVISLAIYYAQILLCKFAFLQDKGEVLALNNRRLYHVTSYFLFIFNMVVGVFAGLKRILLSLVLGTIRLGRLDNVLIMRGFERLDSGHMSYVAMMIVDVTHNHPVLRTFIELLEQVQRDREATIASGVSSQDLQRRHRIKNKWWKAVTLVNNPPLVLDRIQQLYRTRADRTAAEAADIPGLHEVQASTGFVMSNVAYINDDGGKKDLNQTVVL